jgi:transcriptional regulator with XRE-family HTH domain
MLTNFKELLQFHRYRLGLSQAAIADFLGVPLRTYWGWEAGVSTPTKITQRGVFALLEALEGVRPVVKVRMRSGRKRRKEELQDVTVREQATDYSGGPLGIIR